MEQEFNFVNFCSLFQFSNYWIVDSREHCIGEWATDVMKHLYDD